MNRLRTVNKKRRKASRSEAIAAFGKPRIETPKVSSPIGELFLLTGKLGVQISTESLPDGVEARFDFQNNIIVLSSDSNNVVESLCHELTHALQFTRGQGKFELLGIEPNQQAIAIAQYHVAQHRAIEAEAYYLQDKPELLLKIASIYGYI